MNAAQLIASCTHPHDSKTSEIYVGRKLVGCVCEACWNAHAVAQARTPRPRGTRKVDMGYGCNQLAALLGAFGRPQ